MLGIVRPCRHHLSPALHRRWAAHLCGTCLALRDGHGQLARAATNVDALLVSVLTSAQTRVPARSTAATDRLAGPCPARGMRTATVATGDGARLAAHAALLLAAGHVADHADDRQGAFRHAPVAAAGRRLADRWSDRARATAPAGFDPAALLAVPARQHAIEHGGTATLEEATAPTADAVSAAFAHTAVLAGRPDNAAPLAVTGAAFGRLAHLLDALDDLDDDRRAGRWNPVDATGAGVEATRGLARAQVATLAATLPTVDLAGPDLDARLAHRLLVHETERALAAHARPNGAAAHRPAAAPWRRGAGTPAPRAPRGLRGGRRALLHRPALLRRRVPRVRGAAGRGTTPARTAATAPSAAATAVTAAAPTAAVATAAAAATEGTRPDERANSRAEGATRRSPPGPAHVGPDRVMLARIAAARRRDPVVAAGP